MYRRTYPLFLSPENVAGHEVFRDACAIWDFNEGGGDVVFDRSVVDRPYHGTIVKTSGTGTIERVVGNYGSGVFNDTSSSDARIDLGSIVSADLLSGYPTQEISIFTLVYWDDIVDAATYPRIIDKSDDGNGANGWAFYYRNTDVLYAAVAGSSVAISSSLDTSLDEGFVTIGASYEPSSYRLFENGAFQGSSASLSSAFPTATKNAAISNWNHSTARTFDSPIYFLAVWPRILSDAEQAQLHHEAINDQFWINRTIWIPAAAAGGNAVTSTLATLTITPYASSVNDKTQVTSTLANLPITALQSSINDKTEIVSGTFGSLPISALQSSVNDKTQVASTLAALTITPFQSSVAQGTDVTSTLGVLSITALQSSINDKTQVASTLANLPLTGYASVVAQTGDQNVTSTLAQLTITTFTSTVNDKTEVTSSLGSLNLQSFASLVNDKTQVSSTLAALTITPYQSTVQTAANIVSTLANLPITVYQSKVGQPTDITSILAALTITPYNSTIVDVTKVLTGNTPHLPIQPRQSIVAGEGADGGAVQLSRNSSWRRRRSH